MKPSPANRFFVTGLCLQGNKGGPALALSLAAAIRGEIPDARFVFAVPAAGGEWEHEQRWAQRYGFEICANTGLGGLVPPICFLGGRLRRLLAWRRTLRTCDALIQMSAVCYIGPPAGPGTFRAVARSPRVADLCLARLAGRPLVAWTQSYGPLSTAAVRFFARRDLRRQPLVFCRGDDCAAAVRELLPGAAVRSFPDVAVTLPFDMSWGSEYLARAFPGAGRFVTLSPSAVHYARDPGRGAANRHVVRCRELCARLARPDRRVLLVPHTLRPARPDPTVCDGAVAEIVAADAGERVALVRDDLSPAELKAVIAHAEFHVGARYHSLVAALSAGVPALALAWHPKYRDLMRAYGLEEYVAEEADDRLGARLRQLEAEGPRLRPGLAARQAEAVDQVRENARLFCAVLRQVVGGRAPR